MALAARKTSLDLGGGQIAASSVVPRRQLLLLLFLPDLSQPFRRAEARVGIPLANQKPGVFVVNLGPLGLAVWTDRAADIGTLIPRQAQPLESLALLLLRAGDQALSVGVLDSKKELALGLAGQKKVKERGPGASNVQSSCW